eukprot:CAMPEP_0184356354 /NCGR_PEP_ID=MMETSP1089-20130417/102244_1 /TAXON_ID=38269 ORGANISM="Gloeochaete wittrockiana, Strain SAG46.84" /NCGR_SAMPLE_ID=MMETSP1089 /ASSEMBLY_ACC=CAM_ASM_000445 /LENGTH=133 /DNA_ID=CAMNT_0026693543 /DNA_START=362 /DNA_END=760 /DNA_ORIENTATION=-
MKTPYQRRRDDAWRIHLHRLHGIVFMNICDIREDTNVDPNNWGPRFEKLCTSNVPLGFLEYCTVVRSELGPHRLLLGAEIDCVGDLMSDVPPPMPCGTEAPQLAVAEAGFPVGFEPRFTRLAEQGQGQGQGQG